MSKMDKLRNKWSSILLSFLNCSSLYLVAILIMASDFVVKAQDDEEEVKEEEVPTLLDNPTFAFLGTTSWEAIWVVFAIMYGAVVAGVQYQSYKWFIDIISIIDYN